MACCIQINTRNTFHTCIKHLSLKPILLLKIISVYHRGKIENIKFFQLHGYEFISIYATDKEINLNALAFNSRPHKCSVKIEL